MRPVAEIGDDLYTLPPADFTAARDEWIATARQEGDRATATALGALKRPSQAAWLANLLALRRPDVITELVELGEAIRTAQGSVPPGQLRDLSAQRRQQLDAALALGATLAAETGQGPPTRAQLDELEATLAAAMADETAADQVRAGRVVKPLRYSGFGDGFGVAAPSSTARTAARPTPSPTASPASAPSSGGRTARSGPTPEEIAAREAEAAARRTAAQERMDEAVRQLDAATAAERTANGEVDQITAEIAALKERLDDAQARARAARQARIAAERDHESAGRRLRAGSPAI